MYGGVWLRRAVRFRWNVPHDFIGKRAAAGEPPAQRLDERLRIARGP